MCWGTDAMLTVLAFVFIPLGVICLLAVSSSFRKAAAIFAGLVVAIGSGTGV